MPEIRSESEHVARVVRATSRTAIAGASALERSCEFTAPTPSPEQNTRLLSTMRGAVAAGNRHTAEAGAWALAQGGNAVDAVVAAALAAFVAEGPLTGPAGGGFFLVRAAGAEPALLDCFFAVPSRPQEPMDEVLIDFGDASTQVFHVGAGSVAVPGLVAGLAEAHARHGRLPWAALFEPALELAHDRGRDVRAAAVPARDPRPDSRAHRGRARRSTGRTRARRRRRWCPGSSCCATTGRLRWPS